MTNWLKNWFLSKALFFFETKSRKLKWYYAELSFLHTNISKVSKCSAAGWPALLSLSVTLFRSANYNLFFSILSKSWLLLCSALMADAGPKAYKVSHYLFQWWAINELTVTVKANLKATIVQPQNATWWCLKWHLLLMYNRQEIHLDSSQLYLLKFFF